ncbi:MAG TPA: GTPase [Pirellulaceae bacterium]|nr:GTPase [Pirellulaceae bacterium]
MSNDAPQCWYTQLTPTGRGAVAVIGLHGQDAARHLQAFFRPATRRSLADAPLQQILFGRWQTDEHHAGEELVLCRVAKDQWEIYPHGGSAAVEAISVALAAVGCEAIDFKKWCELSGIKPTQQEPLQRLADCRTEREAALLLDQYRGAWSRARTELRQLIARGAWSELKQRLTRLHFLYRYAEHLGQPYRVVLVGAPNVGKSRLINALVGYDRSIVFDQPGTTRDIVTAMTALDGWTFEFSDTAGLRQSADPLEIEGMRRATAQLQTADLVLLVRDATRPNEPLPALPPLDHPHEQLVLWNKCDLAAPPAAAHELTVSAATQLHLSELQATIVAKLCPHPPASGEAVPLVPSDMSLLTAMLQSLQRQDYAALRDLANQLG